MLLNQKQACGYLGIGRYLFETAVNKGYIPFIQPSKRKLFNTEDLDRWQKSTRNHLEFINVGKRITLTSPMSLQTDSVSTLEELRNKYFPKEPRNSVLTTSKKSKRK